MKISETIESRHSVRAFLDKPVAKPVIENILDKARFAPSGVNTQPWKVAVLMGEKKAQLSQAMIKEFEANIAGQMDYGYYPEVWRSPYKARRIATGLAMYQALGITRDDKSGQRAQWLANYRGFDAPVMLIFMMDKDLNTGSFLDYGMFMQNIMLMAQSLGLATCPQAALAEYPHLVRQTLALEEDQLIVAGMSLGFEDTNHPVNNYRTDREPVSEFTTFYD